MTVTVTQQLRPGRAGAAPGRDRLYGSLCPGDMDRYADRLDSGAEPRWGVGVSRSAQIRSVSCWHDVGEVAISQVLGYGRLQP